MSAGDREALLKDGREIFDRRWLSNNGPPVQEFEKKLPNTMGVGLRRHIQPRYCCLRAGCRGCCLALLFLPHARQLGRVASDFVTQRFFEYASAIDCGESRYLKKHLQIKR